MKDTNKRQGTTFWGVAFILTCGAILGFGSAYFIFDEGSKPTPGGLVQDREIGKYSFINPLLECNVAQGSIDSRKQNFKNKLEDFIENLKSKNNVSNVSVLFRDLNNGPTFGINEEEKYTPASLLKIPIVMSIFAEAEGDPTILSKKILFKEEYTMKGEGYQLIPPKDPLVIGTEYTVLDLIERSMIYSDNQAIALLAQDADQKLVSDVFALLGRGEENGLVPGIQVSIKEYASFFRVLFNGSYLTKKYSNTLLEILSRSEFNDGLRAGVPNNIEVSHKFGEAGSPNGNHQLHDCGIVYFPEHPYLLCVMTEGEKTIQLEETIESISQFVFEEISSQY